MSELMKRMQKASFVDNAAQLSKSELFNSKHMIRTPVHMLNVAFSGKLDGGFNAGLHQIAGPSGTFKSNLSLVLVKAFQDKYEDGIVLFYDSEFGASQGYFSTFGIDEDRVLHIPIMNMEEFKFDIMKKLEDITKDDHVMIFVDSIGNLASKKELEDALKESSAADMTRAKMGKGLTRMVTPYLTKKNIPMLCINHVYDTQELYSKKIVSGGTGWRYSSHSVFIMGKRQVKDGTELAGFEFVMNTDKSRYIREKTAIPITVTFEGGINEFSGLLDVAVATGHVVRPNNRSYVRPFVLDQNREPESRLWRKSELDTIEFWGPILEDESFKSAVEKMYSLTSARALVVSDSGEVVLDELESIKFDKETGEIYED